eukprot:CAMPEP_0175237824 /NCGR_PEP_ID=MMETSP0093-20121207/28716_1 /TAXON_ID=311494 /ORGANISM="Alexandrium monilatum, Strain CCMP3105" /LENGTH=581 /DNA_ID=CAMNT_0016531809 /DNA_START=49 /DNA_END=1792 /DNA_ORIENTATION=+
MTAWTAHGSAFRGSSAVVTGHMRAEDLRAAMLDELMGALGHGNRVTEDRLQAIEEALRPMFRSLHKNEHGNLDHSGVRYALHRLFVMRHGMFIKGLEPGGEGWTGSSPTEVLDDRVPAYVQGLFEQRLDGRGLGMHEVAILAATLEHLVHDEANARLKVAYEVNGVPLKSVMSRERAESVIDTYMVLFLLGENSSSIGHKAIKAHEATMSSIYPSWPESQKFTREVQDEVVKANRADPGLGNGILSFNATSTVIAEIMERYGRWQDSECKLLKASLTALEDKGSGRVLLKDFYGSAKDGAWQFTESVAYLKDLGALDDSSPQRSSVIIPNYINSHSNCLASSGIFSVCCLNECEPLLGHIEREVGTPDAEPERLLEIVANLPSSSVKAPRELPADLRNLLQQVVKQHGGKVPLHGRLFAQWLHHAFPRECPYPHKTGTTNPMTADEWISEKADRMAHASEDEMDLHIFTRNASSEDAAGASEPTPLLWTAEEELVVSTTSMPTAKGSRWRSCLLSSIMALVALASLAATLWSNCKAALQHWARAAAICSPLQGRPTTAETPGGLSEMLAHAGACIHAGARP